MARRRRSRPTSSRRAQVQSIRDRYARAREDAQLAGLIPTVPEGALKPEVVDPATQEEQHMPEIYQEAARKGWSVPEKGKRLVVKRLLEPFRNPVKVTTITDQDGNTHTIETPIDQDVLTRSARVLIVADQKQYERDNPEEAGKAKGGNVNVGVVINDPYELYKKAVAEVEHDEIEETIAGAGHDLPAVPPVVETGTEDGEQRGAEGTD